MHSGALPEQGVVGDALQSSLPALALLCDLTSAFQPAELKLPLLYEQRNNVCCQRSLELHRSSQSPPSQHHLSAPLCQPKPKKTPERAAACMKSPLLTLARLAPEADPAPRARALPQHLPLFGQRLKGRAALVSE